ncbi:MAG: hypothetical protein ACJ748_14810 [Flavisolibacter sp.]
MKVPAQSIQFSGYPLKIACNGLTDPNNTTSLQVIKPEEIKKEEEEEQLSKTMDEPENWDEQWFNNYE